MTESRLNKILYTDINRLKLLDKEGASNRFRLQQSPFPDDDEALNAAQQKSEFIVTGLIFPQSNIYNQRSYLIEMKLTKAFPIEPPEVRFLTPMYHPNVSLEGKICNELLSKTAKWTPTTSLVQVIQAVIEHIDHPDLDRAARPDLGKEYHENRSLFDRNALEFVLKHGLSR